MQVSKGVREQVRQNMKTWGCDHVLAPVRFIGESGIERGTPGQSVYAIVDQATDGAAGLVGSIVRDETLPEA